MIQTFHASQVILIIKSLAYNILRLNSQQNLLLLLFEFRFSFVLASLGMFFLVVQLTCTLCVILKASSKLTSYLYI